MLLNAHSGLRYLVFLSALLVIAHAAYGMATGRDYDTRMRILSAVFTGFIDLTVVLGLANLFTGSFYPQLGGHIVMMVFAAVIAHVVHGVMKRRPADKQSYAPHLAGTLITLVVIVVGIMAIGRPIVGFRNDDTATYSIAQRFLGGEFEWLDKGDDSRAAKQDVEPATTD